MNRQADSSLKKKINPVIMVLIAGLAMGFYGIYNIYKGYESQNWPTTQGKIIFSSLTGAKQIMGRRAFIRFEYSVAGRRYVGRQISYTHIRGNYSSAVEILRRYPIDKTVTIYYDPDNPRDAVLETEISGRIAWLFILSGLAVILGLMGLRWKRS